jgi:hypothetical protein
MKKLFLCKLNLVLALIALTVASCEYENTEVSTQVSQEKDQTNQSIENLKAVLLPPSSKKLPEAVNNQINSSKSNLLNYLDKSMQISGVTVLGTIKTTNALNLSKEILASKESIIATGDITQSSSVVAGKLRDIYSGNELLEVQKNISDVATSELKIDDQVLEITWNYKNNKIKSLCFYRSSGIVWDNVLGGLIMTSEKQIKENLAYDSQSKKSWKSRKIWWEADWLWGSKRGEIGTEIKIYYTGSRVSNTDNSDWGYISLGHAKSYSKTTKSSGTHGEIQYALGLCTPFGSLSFDVKGFKVSFSGLGSNVVANGTMSLYP